MARAGQTVTDIANMHIEQMCDASHQPPAFTGQDIQCHPQVLTKHTVTYKTMNGTDVNNTHNIKYNLTANIVVQVKRLQGILF